MNDAYFQILDIAHGIVMTVLMYFVFRLLVFRREGAVRVRYLAAGLLVLALLQTLNYFDEESTIQSRISEIISIVVDGGSILLSVLILWLFYRNRHIYPKRIVQVGSGILIGIMLCFVFCAAFGFAEWTYGIYLLLSTIGWISLCLTIERLQDIPAGLEKRGIPLDDPFADFRFRLEEVMRKDRFFCNEELKREDVCRKMLTNRTTFTQNLQKAYGKSFSEYLRDMRLEEAAKQLRETDTPVDQIAFDVGLKSASGFYRNFLLSYGMTPNQYRQKYHSEA